MTNKITNERFACSLLEGLYVERMKKQKNYLDLEEKDYVPILFPNAWYSNTDYMKKMQFLKTAMDNNINLNEVENISDFER